MYSTLEMEGAGWRIAVTQKMEGDQEMGVEDEAVMAQEGWRAAMQRIRRVT